MYDTDTGLEWDKEQIIAKFEEGKQNFKELFDTDDEIAAVIGGRLFEFEVTYITLDDTYKIVNEILGTNADWRN